MREKERKKIEIEKGKNEKREERKEKKEIHERAQSRSHLFVYSFMKLSNFNNYMILILGRIGGIISTQKHNSLPQAIRWSTFRRKVISLPLVDR